MTAITDQAVEAAAVALHTIDRSCTPGMSRWNGPGVMQDSYRRWARSILGAATPHIAAQALRDYADQQHPHAVGHTQRVEYGTGIEHDTECAGCGSSWNSDEGGCTERVELLRAANALVTPPACDCHETGAPCNCADEFQETR